MKKYKSIILLIVFVSLLLSSGSFSISNAADLYVRIFVEKSEYIQGEDIHFEIQIAQNGAGIPNAQACAELLNANRETLWGACALTDLDGFWAETLEYGFAIPSGYQGYLILTGTGVSDGQEAYSEVPIPYGVDGGDDDDEETELDLEIITYDAVEFTQGNNITVGMTVRDNGYPVINAEICPRATDDFGNILFDKCLYSNANGVAEFQLIYGQHILTGYYGKIYVWANVTANGGYAENSISIPYKAAQNKPITLQLFGPTQPIQQGGTEDIGIAGIITSQGARLDGATISMQVNGQTFQTTSGTYASGEFNWYWNNTAFPAGNHIVVVTVSKSGYQTATGEIPFTLLGENYNYWVNMDAIPAAFNPGATANLPGILSLGGNPVSDWIEIDVTSPSGKTTTYTYQTGTNGRFTHQQPAMTESGIYQLVVYRNENRAVISQTYLWTVGATPTPTLTPAAPQATAAPTGCEITEVQYQNPVTAGQAQDIRGKVVCANDAEKIPQADWYVWVSGISPNPTKVQTDQNGIFNTTLTLNNFLHEELFIIATDQEEGWTRKDYWIGPLKVVIGLEPDLQLSQTDYDTGELLEGKLNLNPSLYAQGWDNGLEIIYQVVGPIGGAEQLYLFKSPGNYRDGIDAFYWKIPPSTEYGDYKITAFIVGSHIPNQNLDAKFWVNDIRHTNVDAFVETGADEWSSGFLVGQYTDADQAPIPTAEVRVTFQEGEAPFREFTLTGHTDQEGVFEIDLEPLDLFAGQGQDDPWWPRNWLTTVYADKEGYATGSTILGVTTPTISPYLEIIAINPPLDTLSKLTAGGINYTDRLPLDIDVTVKYNNIFDGGKLNLIAEGNWALSCVGGDAWSAPGRKAHLSVNGEELPEWNIHQKPLLHRRSWTLPGNIMPSAYYWYPRLETQMDAQQGLGQIATIRVSGELFGFSNGENINPCNTNIQNPAQPPDWLAVGWSGAKVHISLGHSKASLHYRLSPPTLGASGRAWVSPTDGKLTAEIRAGQATGYVLKNQGVQLSIIAKDLGTGAESDSQEITVVANATTNDKGMIELPLTALTNPCELEKKAQYFVKMSGTDIEGEQRIPIELRCIEKLEFEMNPDAIALVQATDLSNTQTLQLAAGKEAGVRVYYAVNGEIYQPTNKPVTYQVKFELLQPDTNKPVVTQLKQVSLTEEGATVAWANPSEAPNQAGIGLVTQWEDKPTSVEGSDLTTIDFVFTPRQGFGKSNPFKIRITIDPNEVYGKKVEQTISGTVHTMKTLHLIIVPVNIMDGSETGLIFEQTSFLHETYPLGLSNLILDLKDPYFATEIPLSCTSSFFLKEIACALGTQYGTGGDANHITKIIGIVENETWQIGFWNMKGTAGLYSAEFWDSATTNVALVRHNPANPKNTTAHELGHMFGLELSEQYKTNPPNGIPVTGLVLIKGQIIDLDATLGKKDPSSRKQLAPAGWMTIAGIFDLMGNAGFEEVKENPGQLMSTNQGSWVIPKTYTALFEALKDPPNQDIFFIQGVIDSNGLVTLNPITRMPGMPLETSTEGDYELQLLDSGGNILFNTRFGYTAKPGIFDLKVPYTPGVGRIVVLQGNTLVSELVRSPSSPEISLLPLTVGGLEQTELQLNWTATDVDNDSLTYSVGYHCDGTDVWIPLAANLSMPAYTVNLMQLPEGTCTLKVTASDGINSAFATSDTFTPPPKGPIVRIDAVAETYRTEEPVFIYGQAFDLKDGSIAPENFYWVSDRDGDLGSGNPLAATLSEGSHNLTLYVADSSGNISVAIAAIQVTANGDEMLTGMGSGLQSLWVLICIVAVVIAIGVLLILWLVRRGRKPAPAQRKTGRDQYNRVQDAQGRWWYQDQNNGQWHIWNGKTWQPSPNRPNLAPSPPQSSPKSARQKTSGKGNCLFSFILIGGISALVVGAVSLIAFNFFPDIQIPAGTGETRTLLTQGGGGLLLTLLGMLLIHGGLRAILTRRATVEDEWGRQTEKRGCSAILNGISQLGFGILLLGGGVGLLALVFFQEVWYWLGF